MADQLSIQITTPGSDAALQALRAIQTNTSATAQAITTLGGMLTQSAQSATAALTQTTQAVQTHTTAVGQAHTAWLSLGGVMGGLPGPLGDVGRAFGGLSVRLNETQVGMLAVGSAFTAAGAGIASGLGEAIKEATQYQRTFAEVQVVSQATTAEMEAMQAKAIELGASTQFNSQKIAKAFYELSSAGLTVTESLQAIEPITRMATIGNLDLGKSAEDVVKILRQYSLDASQTSHVVDVLTVAVQGSILHWTEVGEAYRNIAGRAHGMNVSLEETTGALMVASNAGLTAAMAGTAVGTFLDRLAKGSGEAGKAIQALGLRLYDEQGAFVGLNAVVRQVADATAGMTEQEKNKELSMLAGARAAGFLRNALAQQLPVMIDGNSVLLKGADLLDYYTQQAKNADGASRKAAETIQQTLDAQLKVLSGTIQEVGIRLGTEFIPALSAITPQVTSMINQFVQAPPNIHATAAALLAVASATTIAAGTFLTATAVAAAFGTTLAAAAAAAVVAAAPILAIGAAIALVSVAWINDWGNIRETTTATATVITGAATQTVSDLTTIYDYLNSILIPKWQQWIDVQTTPQTPTAEGPSPIPGLTPQAAANQPVHALSGDTGEVAIAEAMGARSGEAWSKGYVASITEDASGEKITGMLLLDPSALNQQGSIAGGAMGTGFSDEFTNTVTNGSATAFSTMDSEWSKTLDAMKLELEAKQLTIHIFDAESHRADLYAQGALSANIVGKAMGETLAANLDIGLSVQMAMDRILAKVKGNISKAIQEAAAEDNQAAVAGFLQEETMRAAVTTAIKEMDAARKAEILTMQAQQGTFDTLLHLYQSGAISTEAYQQALDGVVASHTKAKTASEEHKAAIAALVQSTDAAAVSQGLYEQHLDAFVEKTAASIPAIEGQARALINAGDSMGAARVEAQALGLSVETLIAASQGNAAAQTAVKVALDVVTGAHKGAAAATKDHNAAVQELLKSTDAAAVAQGLYGQALTSTINTALSKSTIEVKANVQALLNQGDTFEATKAAAAAAGVSFATFTAAVNGNIRAQAELQAALKNAQDQILKYGEVTNRAARVGIDLMAGVTDGITQSLPKAREAMRGATTSVVQSGAEAIGAHSPSTLAAEQIGVPIADGIAEGVEQAMPATERRINEAIQHSVAVVGQATAQQVTNYIAQMGNMVPVYGPSASDLARQQSVANWMQFNTSGYGLDGYIPQNTALTGFRPLTQQEAMGQLATTMQFGVNTAGGNNYTNLGGQTLAQALANSPGRRPPVETGGFTGLGAEDMGALADALLSSIGARGGSYGGIGGLEGPTSTRNPIPIPGTFWGGTGYTQSGNALQMLGIDPNALYDKLLNQAASSQLSSLMSKLPLSLQAQYGAMAAGGDVMGTLQALWAQGGGNSASLTNLLNNPGGAQSPIYNPLLGASANAILGQGAAGGGGGGGGITLGSSGSGEAVMQLYAMQGNGPSDPGNPTRDTNNAVAAMTEAVQRANTHMQTLAKNLANSVPLVMQSWSSISDYSKQAENSISKIPGAFSAFAIDLNAKMASSISGSWTLPTIGGPSGPTATGPGSGAFTPSGNTAGGANFAALQALAAQVTAEHPDLSADSQARLIQQGMRTNTDYLKVVGTLTDTTDDLNRQQADAVNQVQNWTNVVNQQGAAYASGTGAMQSLVDAQQRLTDITNQLAATVSAPSPTPTTSVQPVNTQLPSNYTSFPGGSLGPPESNIYSVGGITYYVGQPGAPPPEAPPPTPTTTPTTTTPTTTTTTSTSTTKPTGPILIGTTATGLDVYQMPDGSVVRVPKGSPPPSSGDSTAAAKLAQGAQAGITVPAYVSGTAGPDVSTAIGSLGAPLIAQGDAVTTGRMASSGAVNLTANITLNNAASTPQLAAVLVRQIREEFRRQGTDVTRLGGL